jgi:Cu(I)/Ag(I) efflux system membrane fusion protein
LGVESGGEVAVESGVAAGERVVVSAQFLVDSESKLREATAKMLSPGSGNPPEHDMDTMDTTENSGNGTHGGMQHD